MKQQIVRALAGRDKGKFFLVLGKTEDGRLLLVNGKDRRIGHPKKKKVKHTEMIDREIPETQENGGMLTDRAVRKIIKEVTVFFETRKE